MLPSDLRIPYIRFRCRNNNLPIEIGSYVNTERHSRLCNKCNCNEIGDEFHVLFKCPYFGDKRKKYITKRFQNVSSIIAIKELFLQHGKTLENTCKFIREILNEL